MTTATLDIATVRNAFPALNRPEPFLFADNAGGSQCLASVAGAISDYLLNANAQLGADYPVSVASGKLVAAGVEAARTLFNAERQDEVFFSSSSTQCAENLARALEADFNEGDEIIITPEHEGQCTSGNSPWICVERVRSQPTRARGRSSPLAAAASSRHGGPR
jgi:selenocysteine lyase/cysteine desulfurase